MYTNKGAIETHTKKQRKLEEETEQDVTSKSLTTRSVQKAQISWVQMEE